MMIRARGLGIGVLLGSALYSGCGGAEFRQTPTGAGAGGRAGAESGAPGSAGSAGDSGGVAGTSGGSVTAGGGSAGASVGAAGEGDSGSGGDDSALPSECPCAAPTPTCEAGKCIARGPTMVKAGLFYVDSSEVTVEQYAAFARDQADAAIAQSPECAWNHAFEPTSSDAAPNHPVTGVDFCDAVAFCAWADKRLCGKIGGGALLFQELADATKNQWFAACAGPKAQLYPYGPTHELGACNDDSGSGGLANVGSFEDCSGFYAGVYDMVGNVAEWVNACDASLGAADGCETIGASYASGSTCSSSSLKHRDEQLPTVGFRCCSE